MGLYLAETQKPIATDFSMILTTFQ